MFKIQYVSLPVANVMTFTSRCPYWLVSFNCNPFKGGIKTRTCLIVPQLTATLLSSVRFAEDQGLIANQCFGDKLLVSILLSLNWLCWFAITHWSLDRVLFVSFVADLWWCMCGPIIKRSQNMIYFLSWLFLLNQVFLKWGLRLSLKGVNGNVLSIAYV